MGVSQSHASVRQFITTVMSDVRTNEDPVFPGAPPSRGHVPHRDGHLYIRLRGGILHHFELTYGTSYLTTLIMDYIRALELNYSPFRLLLLDIVCLLQERAGQPFATERTGLMIAYLVWVSPAYIENRVRALYREHADLQQRSVDRAYSPRVIFREPGLISAVLLVWASTASSLWQEAEDFLAVFRGALAALPNMIPAGAEDDSGYDDAASGASEEDDGVAAFMSPAQSPVPEPSPAPPSSPASNASAQTAPMFEDVTPPARTIPAGPAPASTSSSVSVHLPVSPLELPECLKQGGGSAAAQPPTLPPVGTAGAPTRMPTPTRGTTPTSGAFQPYRRPSPRRPVALPLRPVSVIDEEGRITSQTADRRLPYARLMGQQRPSSPPPPRPTTPATPMPSADSSNPLGRIRITRAEDDSLVSEWIPSAGPNGSENPDAETFSIPNEAEPRLMD